MGTIASFTCINGFMRHGSDSRTCQRNRIWTNQLPTCIGDKINMLLSFLNSSILIFIQMIFLSVLVPCQALILPNGEVSYNTSAIDEGYLLYTKASFTCNSGYSVNGSRFSICQTLGTWNLQTPTCIGK